MSVRPGRQRACVSELEVPAGEMGGEHAIVDILVRPGRRADEEIDREAASRTELAQRDDIGDRGLDGHGWYGPSASPQPQRGIGAPGCELITARPHSRYPTKAERNSGSSGRRRAAEHLADERGHGLRVVRIHPSEHGRGRRGVKVTAAWVVPV